MALNPLLTTASREELRPLQSSLVRRVASRQQRRYDLHALATRTAQHEDTYNRHRYDLQSRNDGFDIGRLPVIGGIATGAGTFLGGTLDVLGRPAQAIAGGVLGAQGDERAGGGIGQGFLRGLTGTNIERQDFNWATILENQGVEHEGLRNVAGFVLGAVADPTNLLAFGPGARLLRGAYRGITAGAQRTPGVRTVIDAFSPHIGRVPITRLRRELRTAYGSEGDKAADYFADQTRRLGSLQGGGAAQQAVRRLAPEFQDIPKEDRVAAFRAMVESRGQPWENALKLTRNEHQRKVVSIFQRENNFVRESLEEAGPTARIKSELLDVSPVEGTYARELYLDPAGQATRNRTITALRRQDARTTARLRRERIPDEALDDPTLVDDAALVAIFDHAETRLLAQRARLINDDGLAQIGLRQLDDDAVLGPGEKIFNPHGPRQRLLEIDDADAGRTTINVPDQEWVGPSAVVDALDSMVDPVTQGGILSMVDQINAFWKPSVTSIFPAFHARNIYSNVALNAHAGMFNPMWYLRATRLQKGATEVVVQQDGGRTFRMAANDFLDEVEQLEGVNTGTRLFRATAEEARPEGGVAGRIERFRAGLFGETIPDELTGRNRAITQITDAFENFSQPLLRRNNVNPFRWGHTVNEATDNNAKMAHIMWRISKGDTLDRAVTSSREALPNYAEFARSPAFRSLRTAVPFASWMRFNLPRQFQLLIEQPYAFSKVSQAATSMAAVRERVEADERMLPDWVLERMGFLAGEDEDGRFRTVYGLGLPAEDLNQLFASFGGRGEEPGFDAAAAGAAGQLENLISQLGPFPRVFLELAANRSFFTGDTLDDRSLSNYYRQAWQWTAGTPGLQGWLEVEERTTRSGDKVYVGNPIKMYLLSSIIGRAGHTVDRVIDVSAEHDVGLGVSLISGVKVSKLFPRAPSDTPFWEKVEETPALREVYDQYESIPMFPQFGDPNASRKANKALNDIADHRRWLVRQRPELSEDDAWDTAASVYGEQDPEGELFARQVRNNGWSRQRDARSAFLETHPELDAAFKGLSQSVQRRLLGTSQI